MNTRAPDQQSDHKRRLAERDAAARDLRAAGWSFPAIARVLHVSLGTAHRVARDDAESE